MLESSTKKANLLNKQFFSNSKEMDNLANKASSLEMAISTMDRKRKNLITAQNKNKNL